MTREFRAPLQRPFTPILVMRRPVQPIELSDSFREIHHYLVVTFPTAKQMEEGKTTMRKGRRVVIQAMYSSLECAVRTVIYGMKTQAAFIIDAAQGAPIAEWDADTCRHLARMLEI